MPELKVLFTKKAKKNIQKLDVQVAKRIQNKLNHLIDSGKPLEFAEPLTKPTDAQYRWRVGDYRVLFDFDVQSNTVIILKVQHRREVYRK